MPQGSGDQNIKENKEMSTAVELPNYELINEGINNANLAAVIDVGVQRYKDYDPKDYLKLVFNTEQMSTVTGKPLQASCLCTKNLGRKSKLGSIVKALLNTPVLNTQVAPSRKIEVADLVGRPCRLSIIHETKENGDVFANIDKVLPPAMHFATAPVGAVVSAPANTNTVVTVPHTVTGARALQSEVELRANIHAVTHQEKKKPFATGETSATTEVSSSS
jgi:hypothetical protein